ncbi:adenosine monophosphate-protein transferase [Prosthecomicrobium hirschii]|uniref:Fic/DOC family protein n=1 Tax=Prosthecodimorpha hirschii TaxID=665126 RepID=UPI00112D5049|nr:Fic family protein [Prosthecomicrobium hirschii]TPQ51562.1 adenosine monophosphate-protein transferase [Prosthecomicrobium hirschii]
MYTSHRDPYCYAGTTVLKNRLGLRDQARLDAFETEVTAQRFREPLPSGDFSPEHYCAVHRHIFGDVYSWAGRYRTVRIFKGRSAFCYPEFIDAQMVTLFHALVADLQSWTGNRAALVAGLSRFLMELNAIHPFREGNGRTQLAFAALVAQRAGHRLAMEALQPEAFLAAMIDSFGGDATQLREHLADLIA